MIIKIYFKLSVSSKSDVLRVTKELNVRPDIETLTRHKEFGLVTVETMIDDKSEMSFIEDHKCVAMVTLIKQ